MNKEYSAKNRISLNENVEEAWTKIKNNILKSAEEIIG